MVKPQKPSQLVLNIPKFGLAEYTEIMRLNIKSIILSFILFGLLPAIFQTAILFGALLIPKIIPPFLRIFPLVMMFSFILPPFLIVGYYFITKRLLNFSNFSLLTAIISSLVVVFLSYNIGAMMYMLGMLGSVFPLKKGSYNDITNIKGLFSLSSFPVSALIGSVSAKLYFDIKTKSKIFKVENLFPGIFIYSGVLALLWNFNYLNTSPQREQTKALQKLNSEPYLELNDIKFTSRQLSVPLDWEKFQDSNLAISMNIPSFLRARLGINENIFISYKAPTEGRPEKSFAEITMYSHQHWGLNNNFQKKDDAIVFLIDYLKPQVKTINRPIKINTNGESSETKNGQELFFITTEYSNPTQAKYDPLKTLYIIKGTQISGYEIWKVSISGGDPNNVDIVKRIIESVN